jgi:hypothetical protein
MEALRWLRDGGLDFEIVCDFANVSPQNVRKKFGRKRGSKTRA